MMIKNQTMMTCRGNSDENVFESVPESQMDNQRKPPLTKRRRLATAEASACLETPFVSESLNANKTLDGSQGNVQLVLAESIVADSLQGEHSNVFERNENDISHGMTTKVERISDSLNVSADCRMSDCQEDATFETLKTVENEMQVKSVEEEAIEKEIRVKSTEEESRNKENKLPDNKKDKQEERMQEFKVPVGFLCSRMPRKVCEKVHWLTLLLKLTIILA